MPNPTSPTVEPTVLVEMIFPEQANHYGTLFGGNALALMAKAAFVAATQYARANVVMARSDRVDFKTPVRVGEILRLTGRVTREGTSSMTVEVTGTIECPTTELPQTVLQGTFEMVVVDASGRPRPIQTRRQRKEHPSEDP